MTGQLRYCTPVQLNRLVFRFINFALTVVGFSALVSAASPAIVWDFGPEESTPLVPHGGIHRDVPGPRSPEFPSQSSNNTAVKFDGNGSRYVFADPGPNSNFDFKNGDSITIEAWVNPEPLRTGEHVYVVGKGRTGNPGVQADNQNWALRVREQDGKGCISFLFATPLASGVGKGDSHWHRWTSLDGFANSTGWHHISVTYKYGEPESIRGYIDGAAVKGKWDMGGVTKEEPVVDDDAIWIGSSNKGTPSNSFRGAIDAVAIHREALSEEVLKKRFDRVGGPNKPKPQIETMPSIDGVPEGKVLVTFSEGMPSHERWLNEGEEWPVLTDRWVTDSFLIPRMIKRYDDWGIRASWKPPVLVRMVGDVAIPKGRRKVILRARAISRLWIDGKVVARTEPMIKSPPDGEEPIVPVPQPPFPGLRAPTYQQQEVIEEIEFISDKPCRVVLETIVGGRTLRTDTSELLIALQDDGSDLRFHLLAPSREIELTDADIEEELLAINESLTNHEDQIRRSNAAKLDSFWAKRHQLAREVSQKQLLQYSFPADEHPIDLLISKKIVEAKEAAAKTTVEESEQFHKGVLPVLRERCFRCHGEKDNGGLKLDSIAGMLRGGDSEVAAVVPNNSQDSELIRRIKASDESERMPPTGEPLSATQTEMIEKWIQSGAKWPAPPIAEQQITIPEIVDDSKFLRRVSIDLIGMPLSSQEARAFLEDRSPDKRERLVDRLLADERWADNWMGYWLDLLAENPALINQSLNSTGPFRWFLHESLRDGKSYDRFVTELVMMRGSPYEGGSAGFALAGENDSPLAAKSHVIGNAFLGVELQCARCHDSPYHSTKQRDLYSLAAMLERKAVTVPKTSTVPAAFFEKKARESLIKVTLKPGELIEPVWPFGSIADGTDLQAVENLVQDKSDSRERLAALITSPYNKRFAQVIVNRLWQRYMGTGFVEPVFDWEGREPSHPELLDWLVYELMSHDYDLKHITRLIMNSKAYQRKGVGNNKIASPDQRFFNAPDPRRLTAEQVVDSLFMATGAKWDVEELTFNPTGKRPPDKLMTLGAPQKAWMMTSLNNERDRPSLSLPRAGAVAEVLEAFGWTGSRQTPRSDRETDPNVLQPGVLANSNLVKSLTRASIDSEIAHWALKARSPEELVDDVFLRTLSRYPTEVERSMFSNELRIGFEKRIVADSITDKQEQEPLPTVTFFNHLQPEANTIAMEQERRVRRGPSADPRLDGQWREVYEDFVWSVINTREFVWIP